MDSMSQEPPQYNQLNPSQFVTQPTYGQPAYGQTAYVQQIAQPVIVNAAYYGPDPMTLTCFHCRSLITTRIIESPNALCCYFFGCWAMCCPGCQDVEHRCPNCNVILGNYKP